MIKWDKNDFRSKTMRLDKYLAETAQCTRSEAKTLLQKGRVTVK